MFSGGNQTDGNTLERFLTPYQYSTLPLMLITKINQWKVEQNRVRNYNNIIIYDIYIVQLL